MSHVALSPTSPGNRARAMAKKIGANGLKDFADNKEPWTRNGALEIDVIEKSDSEYSFNVTRCRYAEIYRELGFADLGDVFSCTRDFEFSRGFKPRHPPHAHPDNHEGRHSL